MKEHWNSLRDLLISKTPFAFSKMNDGEMNLINRNKVSVSRGAQDFNEELAGCLERALSHIQKSYYCGIPCSQCMPELHKKACTMTSCQVPANVFINDNFANSLKLFTEELPKRRVILVCNEEALVHNLPNNIKPYMVFRIPNQNSWSMYEQLKEGYKVCRADDVVMFCCGPLGRVLVHEWFSNMPTITCLELGSFFDPWLHKRCYSYHTNTLQKCSVCNSQPAPSPDFSIPSSVVQMCNVYERVYWENVSLSCILYMYGQDKYAALRYYKLAEKTAESTRRRWFYAWMVTQLTCELKTYTKSLEEYLEDQLNLLYSLDNQAIDALYELQRKLSNRSSQIKWLKICAEKKWANLKDHKFLDRMVYVYKVLNALVICCYYEKDYESSYKYWCQLMENYDEIPPVKQFLCQDNGRFAKMMLGM